MQGAFLPAAATMAALGNRRGSPQCRTGLRSTPIPWRRSASKDTSVAPKDSDRRHGETRDVDETNPNPRVSAVTRRHVAVPTTPCAAASGPSRWRWRQRSSICGHGQCGMSKSKTRGRQIQFREWPRRTTFSASRKSGRPFNCGHASSSLRSDARAE